MTYPVAVIIVAVIVTAILLIKVVPTFQGVFAGFGAELPAFTMMVINMSEFLQAWWFLILAAFFGAAFVIKTAQRKSEKFRDATDKLKLKLPIIGSILFKATVARFGRTLATTFSAGVPLVEALDSVAGATGNVVFRTAVNRIKQDVSSGMQLNFAMRNTGIFPALAVQMAAIGEESGSIDHMLGKAADFYEAEVDDMVAGLSSLMEPIIIVILGTIIGGIVVSMYLPIFKLGQVV